LLLVEGLREVRHLEGDDDFLNSTEIATMQIPRASEKQDDFNVDVLQARLILDESSRSSTQ